MFNYGFELEGFAVNEQLQIVIPSKEMPTDGFPGLVELRTIGGQSLEHAWSSVVQQMLAWSHTVDFKQYEHKFSGADMAVMRRDCEFLKERLEILNIYGKQPRRTIKTLASLQINISNLLSARYTDSNHVTYPARYGLLDVHGIVKRLDEEFEIEIKGSNRQKGMYAIKDAIRLEYRSLPNYVFDQNIDTASKFLNRIRQAVEGK